MRAYAALCRHRCPAKYSTDYHYGRQRWGSRISDIGRIRDRSLWWESRPLAKEKIRNANRALNKKTRQRLRKQLMDEMKEALLG